MPLRHRKARRDSLTSDFDIAASKDMTAKQMTSLALKTQEKSMATTSKMKNVVEETIEVGSQLSKHLQKDWRCYCRRTQKAGRAAFHHQGKCQYGRNKCQESQQAASSIYPVSPATRLTQAADEWPPTESFCS